MFPARSTARLGTKRKMTFAASGSHVVAWTVSGVGPATLIWYQRGAVNPVTLARRTVCVAHNDWAPPMFVYWFCIIARTCSTSRPLPPSDGAFGTPALGQPVGVIVICGPVNDECVGRS